MWERFSTAKLDDRGCKPLPQPIQHFFQAAGREKTNFELSNFRVFVMIFFYKSRYSK